MVYSIIFSKNAKPACDLTAQAGLAEKSFYVRKANLVANRVMKRAICFD